MTKNDTVRVFIPLKLQRRNGRPKIVAPKVEACAPTGVQDPHVLKAIGRAWSWRRKLESGEFVTIQDIARAEKLTDRYVSCITRLSYLLPDVLERLLVQREPPSVTITQMIEATNLPWVEQMERVFSDPSLLLVEPRP